LTATKTPFDQCPYETSAISSATFTIGAETANVINVAIQLKNGVKDLDYRGALSAYLSSDAEGDDVVGTAPTTVAVGTDGVAIPLVAGKAWFLISEVDGDIDLNITLSSGAATYYLILVLPNGKTVASGAITFAA
jgi:hypothetical protein